MKKFWVKTQIYRRRRNVETEYGVHPRNIYVVRLLTPTKVYFVGEQRYEWLD